MFKHLGYTFAGLCIGVLLSYGYLNYFAGPPRAVFKDKGPFGKGRTAVCSGAYQEGIKRLDEYIHDYPAGRNAARAGLFRGKALIGLGDYTDAQSVLKNVIDQYPDSLAAHKSKYKIALAKLFDGDEPGAIKCFQELRSEKNGPLVPEAEAFLRWLRK